MSEEKRVKGSGKATNGNPVPRLFGLLGDPVGHTLSPTIHILFAGRTRNAIGGYIPFEVKRERLSDAVQGAHALGIQGLNVTVPHKSAVIPLLAGIDPLAEQIGAVNTLVYEADGYRGYNTDVTGLRRALEEAGVTLRNAHVVILGAGGAARAAVFLCANEAAAEIVILNRTVEKAEALAAEANAKAGRECARAAGLMEWIDQKKESRGEKYIAIQCTSVGLSPNADKSIIEEPVFFEQLSFAMDIVYRPPETRFLRLAMAAGVPVLGGLSMLLYQAADAFALWFPESTLTKADLQYVMRCLQIQVRGYCAINLIGFMGSGKTSVGHALAKLLHFELWDTDQMIEESSGKSISDIFAKDGEEVFRRLETGVLQKIDEALDAVMEAGATDGLVLSTGGGLPMREENRRWLREGSGRVVYLRVRPETVVERLAGDTTRPLLAAADDKEKRKRVEGLLKERDPVYEECADIVIDTEGKTPRQIAEEIVTRLS